MSSTPTASFRSIGAVALILGGGLAIFFGVPFTLIGIWLIGQGYWIGHLGGLLILVMALALAAAGIWAAKRGRKIYGEIERSIAS